MVCKRAALSPDQYAILEEIADPLPSLSARQEAVDMLMEYPSIKAKKLCEIQRSMFLDEKAQTSDKKCTLWNPISSFLLDIPDCCVCR